MLFIKKKGEDVVSSRKKIMITLIIILLLLTAGVYGYGVYYFTEHFLPGSMVNGFNCSYMTVSQSEELLTQKVGAYVLTIDTRKAGFVCNFCIASIYYDISFRAVFLFVVDTGSCCTI